MQYVNQYLLTSLLYSIAGTADFDDEVADKLSHVNGNDEEEVRKVIVERIKPDFEKRNDQHKAAVKRSLAYYLTTGKANFGYLYDSCMIIFDHPQDPKDLFIWIWEVLFPNESYYIKDVDSYEERLDPNEDNKYLG